MATAKEVAEVMNRSFVQAIIQYGGGSVKTEKGSRVVKTTGVATLNSHFTKGNSAIYAPLSPAYAKTKLKKVGPKPILVFTGAMKKSLVGKGKIFFIGNGTYKMTFPKAVPYAKFHAEGQRFKTGLPKRHPTEPTKKDRRKFVTDLKNNLSVNITALTKGAKRSPEREE